MAYTPTDTKLLSRTRSSAIKTTGEFAFLIPSFERHLKAESKSPQTINSYMQAVTQLAVFLAENGMPRKISALKREHIEAFIVHVLETRSASTAANRFRSLQQFFRWLIDDGEIKTSPMAKMRSPRVPHPVIPIIPEEDLKKLLATCKKTPDLEGARDYAIIRLFITTGARRAEIAGLKVEDIDFGSSTLHLLGKGSRRRIVALDRETVRALDRYLRWRYMVVREGAPELWISRTREPLSHWGVEEAVERRAKEAGLGHIHLHQFRHTFAHMALSKGMNETDLMNVAGWSSQSMVQRYAAVTAQDRALAAQRRFQIGSHL